MGFLQQIKVGDLVRNKRTGEIGIVISESTGNFFFLKVLNGTVSEWFNSNLEHVTDENRSNIRAGGNISRDMV
tara:strand:+ start:1566 stop:1784 length:219 start_codon:yes stop_codon:yes gene_type:complete